MSFLEQKVWIKNNIFNQEQYSEYLLYPHLVSNKQKPFYYLIKYKMNFLLITMAYFIKLVKAKLPILFVKLKS